MAKLCYEGKDQNRHSECLMMAARMFEAPCKMALSDQLTERVFMDKAILTPAELLHTLEYASNCLLDMELFERVVPMSALMEWLASDIVGSKPLLLKARCLKAQAFIEIGYIHEAF